MPGELAPRIGYSHITRLWTSTLMNGTSGGIGGFEPPCMAIGISRKHKVCGHCPWGMCARQDMAKATGGTGMNVPLVLVRTHVYTWTPYIFTHTFGDDARRCVVSPNPTCAGIRVEARAHAPCAVFHLWIRPAGGQRLAHRLPCIARRIRNAADSHRVVKCTTLESAQMVTGRFVPPAEITMRCPIPGTVILMP